ncbi:MAG: N-acetyl-gamma-glutamyl-phosphate reductase [Desulfurococcales archaeon]|nr:N-acetyl-gamma-glutamyl-phosphate reductase [Desulfurococcales archaeon]
MGVVRVSIIGGSGYVGGELLRILSAHPAMDVVSVTSRRFAGKPVHYAHPNLRSVYGGLRFLGGDPVKAVQDSDVVFVALPHGKSVDLVPALLEIGLRVVDLGADFRLKDPEAYRKWYGFIHPYPDLLKKAVYGLPEIHRDELKGAQLIASPGCNATAAILASAPMLREGLVSNNVILVDVKVSSSEAGREVRPSTHHPEREGSMRPYSPSGHRHSAEVVQELRLVGGREVRVSLTPHAVGGVRGVLATVYGFTSHEVSERRLLQAYVRMYGRERFIRIVHRAVGIPSPDPKYVLGSNYVDIGFAAEADVGVVKGFAAIDNLVRGAAGQAVQAVNIALGLREDAGLEYIPPHPI